MAFAGPFAHPAGILVGALGDDERATELFSQSIATAQRLGATVWVRQGEAAISAIMEQSAGTRLPSESEPEAASLIRNGEVWTVSWRDEHGGLAHAKGIADTSTLIQHRGQEVSALQLAGGTAVLASGSDSMIDIEALSAYRQRLAELAVELDRADVDADIGRSEVLQNERDQLLAEISRATGLGGRLRVSANDPAERARKAVTARIRDAIRRLDTVAPLLAAHLDRSIHTGLRCSYAPAGDDALVRWRVDI